MEISLVPISESPQDASQVLSWALDHWDDRLPNYSNQDWADFYSHSSRSNYESWAGEGQELVFLAKRGEDLVGTIALVDFDELEEFRHQKPWIAAFLVNPQVRGQGIGTQILELLEDKARLLGIVGLHLWTEDQGAFYRKRGYRVLASSRFGNLNIEVMHKAIATY